MRVFRPTTANTMRQIAQALGEGTHEDVLYLGEFDEATHELALRAKQRMESLVTICVSPNELLTETGRSVDYFTPGHWTET